MEYLVECNPVFSKKDIYLVSSDGEIFYTIKKKKFSNVSNIEIFDNYDNLFLKSTYHPFRFKGRYNFINLSGEKVVIINTSLRYIYEMFYDNKLYILKAAVWKNRFTLYDYDEVIGRSEIIKINKKRYFKIELRETCSRVLALSMLLIAQSIREKS